MKYAKAMLDNYRNLLKACENAEYIKERIYLNLNHENLDLSKDKFWRTLLLGGNNFSATRFSCGKN